MKSKQLFLKCAYVHAPDPLKFNEAIPMKSKYLIAILTALALCGMITASPVLANPGDTDTSFNGGAPAVTDPGSGNYLDPYPLL